MFNLGAIKLRRFRHHLHGAAHPEAGRPARAITQEEIGAKVGVTKAMVSNLEAGVRTPGLKVATRLSELGVCPAEDWSRPARCERCARELEHDVPECGLVDCPWADAAALAKAAA
jgi:DNA-binding XRE family transcriptional regulator